MSCTPLGNGSFVCGGTPTQRHEMNIHWADIVIPTVAVTIIFAAFLAIYSAKAQSGIAPPQVTCHVTDAIILRDSVIMDNIPTPGQQPWTRITLLDAETSTICWTHL